MPQKLTEECLADIVAPNETIFIPGSAGAPLAFLADLLRKPEHSRNAHLLTSFIPGINTLDIDQLDPSATVTGMFTQPAFSRAQRDGRFRALPVSYAGFVRHLQDNVDIGLTVVQLTAPDASGQCSLGPAVEFMPVALQKSRRVLGLINKRTPRIPGAVTVPYDRLDYVCEVDTPLPEYSVTGDETTQAIARHIAELVPDGAAVQVGLGKVPAALSTLLCDRKNLRLHSGMLSDGMIELAEAGALDPDFAPTTCVLVGTDKFYRWAANYEGLRILGCDFTHDPRTLLGLDGFIAVNSALEVDLFGQCNLELVDGRAVSGAGGAPDFARCARLSHGGRSIVALNASYSKGSRILPCLTEKAITSLPRVDVDAIITEFGIAKLTGASVHERAQAIISVAAPEFRDDLQRAWSAIAARL